MALDISKSRAAAFMGTLFRKSPGIDPDEKSLHIRYRIFDDKLSARGCPFERPCSGDEAGECWLVKSHSTWNDLLIPCGLQLQCYVSGRLSLTTLRVPSNRRILISADDLSSVLLVLWLLNEHHCINRVAFDTSVAFGCLTEHFFEVVLFKPQMHQVKLTMPQTTPPLFRDGKALLRSLKDTTSLEKLELLQIPFSMDAVDEFRLVLDRNKNLKFVSLSNVPMSVKCADALIRVFNSCAALENVHFTPILRGRGQVGALKGTVLGESSIRELSIDLRLADSFPFETLALCPSIQVLKVSGFVGLQNMLCLAKALKRNNVLRVLTVSLFACRNSEVLHSFAQAVAVNTGLQELCIQDLTAIGDIAPYLAQAIVVNQTLQELIVQGNTLSAIDVKMLAVALIGNRTLNQLKILGSEALSERLEGLPEILLQNEVSLRLFLHFGSTYIPFLTRFLRNGQRMKKLTLAGRNAVKPSAVISFFRSLRYNSVLTNLTVCLPGELPPLSVKHLAHLLRTSKSLRSISLGVKMESVDMCSVFQGLEASENILSLQLDLLNFDEVSSDALFKMLRGNCSLVHLSVFGLDNASASLLTKRFPESLEGNRTLLSINFFKGLETPIDTRESARILCENHHRLSLAVGFVNGTSTDDASEEAFRTLARSLALVDNLKEVTGEREIPILKKIKTCLERITKT